MLVIIHLSPPPAPTHPSPQSNDGWDTLALGLGGLSYAGVDCVQLSPTDSVFRCQSSLRQLQISNGSSSPQNKSIPTHLTQTAIYLSWCDNEKSLIEGRMRGDVKTGWLAGQEDWQTTLWWSRSSIRNAWSVIFWLLHLSTSGRDQGLKGCTVRFDPRHCSIIVWHTAQKWWVISKSGTFKDFVRLVSLSQQDQRPSKLRALSKHLVMRLGRLDLVISRNL